MSEHRPTRRNILKAVGGTSAAMALGGGSALAAAAPASAVGDGHGHGHGHGLRIVDRLESDPRMWHYRFRTAAIGWDPGVSVLLPDGYHTSGRRYPVLYLFHGGPGDFMAFDRPPLNIRAWTAGKPIIVVLPDGGKAGWCSHPVSSSAGPGSWEHFHVEQLIPWVDDNFRTYAEYDGRAVSGFSMGGFGALKYAAKHAGRFASVSCHSGPASLRRDNDPVRRIESYRNKRVFLVAGASPDPADPFDTLSEVHVLGGQREFRGLLDRAGIPHEWHERPGGHHVREDLFIHDLNGIIGRLRKA